MPVRSLLVSARSLSIAFAFASALSVPTIARAQSVLGYGEDATAAPVGAIRIRLSNDWHRTRQFGSGNDSAYDIDHQFRSSNIGLEIGALSRVTFGANIPWNTTKALIFVSSGHLLASGHSAEVLDTIRDVSHNGWGNIETYARVVWLGEPGQRERLEPRAGVHVRSALTGGYLLGTGIFAAPNDPFGVGTSDRSKAFYAHSATDFTIGSHFFGSFVARYTKPKADALTIAVRPQVADSFSTDVRPFSAQRKLGDRYELEFTPRLQLLQYFTIGAQYRYHHGAQDHYTGTFTADQNGMTQTLDASALDDGTELTEHRIGFGVVYSAVDAYSRNRSRLPIEVELEHSNVVSVSGNRPKDAETMFSVRVFARLWGAEFSPLSPTAKRGSP